MTVTAVGQAAWARILAAYVGQEIVTFGVVLSARTVLEEAQLAAFPCVRTLPLGCNVDSTNLDLLQQIMKTSSEITEYQFTPVRQLQQWLGFGQRSLFNTIFVHQKTIYDGDEPTEMEMVDEYVRVDVRLLNPRLYCVS
jgi:non-ribosomal peptide synthetase component F